MYSAIYWMTRMDSIKDTLTGTGVIFIIAGTIASACVWVGKVQNDEGLDMSKLNKVWRFSRTLIIVGFAELFLQMFLPSNLDMTLIYAGGKTYEYIKSDTSLQKMPYRTTEYLKLLLEKQIEETKNETDKNN